MSHFLFLLFATAISPGASVEPKGQTEHGLPRPVKMNILAKPPERDCPEQSADEIVVCAERTNPERYRLGRTTEGNLYENGPNKAEFLINENTKISAENEAAQIGPGVQSNRLMARIKFKF